MSIVSGKMKNKILVAACSLLICSSAFAADVNLSEIEFSTANKGFNIVLKTDKNTSFRKTIQNSDKLILELKNTTTSNDFSTIYNDVADINNVTVTPVGKDDLKIQIQGRNVNNSFVSIDSSIDNQAIKQNFEANQINLSLPIENYKPVYEEIDDEEENIEEETSVENILSKINPLTTTKVKTPANNYPTKKNDYKWLTYLGLAIIMFSAFRNLVKTAPNTQIGLSQNLKDREKEIAEKLNNSVRETLSLRSKMAENISAPSINYGLKSYQNLQKNPYENMSTPIRPVRKVETTSTQTSTISKPQVSSLNIPKPTTNKLISKPERTIKPKINDTSLYKETSNVDSKKFLEAMTKIYEKSGRNDLAQGLKNNISKAKF